MKFVNSLGGFVDLIFSDFFSAGASPDTVVEVSGGVDVLTESAAAAAAPAVDTEMGRVQNLQVFVKYPHSDVVKARFKLDLWPQLRQLCVSNLKMEHLKP